MKQVAVLGGGPAGAFAAAQVAAAGMHTVLFDEKLAWEKPCGGGLTYKAYQQYPFLIQNDVPKKFVRETKLAAPRAGETALTLDQPLLIYSRTDLNQLLLDRAVSSGVEIAKTRVLGIERNDDGWEIRTKVGIVKAESCIVATGARNPLRDVGTELTPADTMFALGYYVPGEREGIDIQFLPELEGYIWVFPRCGHLSVGICGKGEPASSLRKRLETYMAQKGLAVKGSSFYSHLLPCLATPAWKSNRVAGDGWLAVGDAAGLVDPITGEGLYYALRSADLAAKTLIEGGTDSTYRRWLRRDFAGDLEIGSRLAQRIFRGSFMFGSVPARMVQFTRRSPKFKAVIQDLFAGTQPYRGLKNRLLKNLNGSLLEIAMSFGFSRLVK
jgi:geranylgeranyl diphosphate/geranylgeranyl-bacteriochlorophyllide a reductase